MSANTANVHSNACDSIQIGVLSQSTCKCVNSPMKGQSEKVQFTEKLQVIVLLSNYQEEGECALESLSPRRFILLTCVTERW